MVLAKFYPKATFKKNENVKQAVRNFWLSIGKEQDWINRSEYFRLDVKMKLYIFKKTTKK